MSIVGAALTTATAWFLGTWLLERLRVRLTGLEALVFAYGAGMTALSLTVFLLACAQALYPPVLLALFPLSAWLWRRTSGDTEEPDIKNPPPVFWLVAIPYAGLYFIHALAPEITSDGAGYHLELIQRYSREHGFPAITTNIYAFLSQGAEMLYLFAYTFGGDSAPKLVHLDMLGATVLAMFSFGRRFGLESGAWAGALLYAVSPIVGRDATSSYNDCALALFVFLVFYAARLFAARPRPGLALLAGALAGMAFAVKYTGFPAAIIGLVAAFAAPRLRRPRPLAFFALGAGLLAAPWLIKNTVVVGNPVAPFFNGFFENPYATPDWEARYKLGLRTFNGFGTDAVDFLRAPWELAMDGRRLGGLLGPAFLLVPIALFDWRRRTTRLLLWAGVLAAAPWLQNAGARFWIPALPFLMLAVGAGLSRLPGKAVWLTAVVAAQGVLCWPDAVEVWRPGVWKLPTPPPWGVVAGVEDRRDYLRRSVDRYDLAEVLNGIETPGAAFTFEQLPEAYIDRHVLTSYQSALGETLTESLWAAQNADWAPAQSLAFSIPSGPVTAIRMEQTESSPDSWIINELRFYQGPRAIPFNDDWRAAVPANPWAAPLAFDGAPFSRWKSWRPVRPGMRFEVDFGEALRLTAFEILYPLAGNFGYNLALSARDADGEWFKLPAFAEAEQRFHPIDEAAYRRWAVQRLKEAGVSLLVLNVDAGGWNLMAPKVEADPAAWGLVEAARTGPFRVYRLPR